MTTSVVVSLFPLVAPFEVPPVNLSQIRVGLDYIAHGMRTFSGQKRYCACCDAFCPGNLQHCPDCSAPFERNLP